MKWVITTCANSSHIVRAQQWLFKKYVPSADLHYIDLGHEPVETWCMNVLKRLQNITDKYIIFGLDDYLPIDKINMFRLNAALRLMDNYDRFELGWGASKKQGFNDIGHLEYGRNTPYKVSCQFSIWNTEALRMVLFDIKTTPWKFEVNGYCKAACFRDPVFRWIEESAISGRQKGKVNVLGLKPKDLDKLIELGYILEQDIIYGWKGNGILPSDKGGRKYAEFYEV
jgi:hypothetical protein